MDRKPNNQFTPRRGARVQMDFIPDLKVIKIQKFLIFLHVEALRV
jgi:hypothetical protein